MIFCWLGFGLVLLFSASLPQGLESFQDPFYFLTRQVTWGVVGLMLFWAVTKIPLAHWWRWSPFLFFTVFVAVIATQWLGATINGAERWLVLGPVRFQPSEFAKPLLILQAVWVLDRWPRLSPIKRLFWCGALVGLIAAIFAQPSLSMALLLALVLWLLAFAGGFPLRILILSPLVLGVGLAIKVSQTSYQFERLQTFLNPFADPQGSGYQVIQSLLAVSLGGNWGVGFGLSAQKVSYLPYAYSDFIFAVFAEEFGLVGVSAVLIFLTCFGLLGLRLSVRFSAPRPVRLLALGTTLVLVVQSFLHIGVVTGCLPPTGMPLPFVSSGGSGLCAALITAGLLIRAAREAGQMRLEVVPDPVVR